MTVNEFITALDAFFDHEDMAGAGEYLRAVCREAAGDNRLLFAVYNEMMGYYRKTGEVERGLDAIEKGLALLPCLGIADEVSGATAYLNAATTLKAFGRPAEGLPLYEKAENVYRRRLPSHDPRMAGLCNNLALALADLERYEEAEARYETALAVLSRNAGKETDIANTFVNMAHLYERLADYEKIEACLDRAKDALEADQNRGGYYAYTCRKCAPSFGHFGYFLYEKELNERADKIYEGA